MPSSPNLATLVAALQQATDGGIITPDYNNTLVQAVIALSNAVTTLSAAPKVASGSTLAGATAWVQYTGTGIYVDVNTTAAGFTTTPTYVTSIGGNSSHWSTVGGSSIYSPTPTGFRVYVRWVDGASLTIATAILYGWHINWIAVS
jgi:hypothetical protein